MLCNYNAIQIWQWGFIFKCFSFFLIQYHINYTFMWLHTISFIFISASNACKILRTFCVKYTNLFFNAIFWFSIHFFSVLRISLVNLSSFQAIINSACVDSAFVTNCAVYCCIESSKLETLFNVEINSFLVSCNFVPFNGRLLNEKIV